jgi:hypothetical protein
MGAPAQVKRELSEEAAAEQREHARRYRQLAMAHAGRSDDPGFQPSHPRASGVQSKQRQPN